MKNLILMKDVYPQHLLENTFGVDYPKGVWVQCGCGYGVYATPESVFNATLITCPKCGKIWKKKETAAFGLYQLKTLLLNTFELTEKDIEIFGNKLKIKGVLICYYDREANNYYGQTYHWWLNGLMQNSFMVQENQVNWLIRKLKKLNNCLKLKEGGN